MFDRQTVRQYRQLMETVLKPLGEKLGVSISVGNASFTANNIRFKLEVAKVGDTGEVINKDAEAFSYNAVKYGLQPSDLNRTFRFQGTTYKIVGCRPRSWKNPILIEKAGRVYKMNAATVVWALNQPENRLENEGP